VYLRSGVHLELVKKKKKLRADSPTCSPRKGNKRGETTPRNPSTSGGGGEERKGTKIDVVQEKPKLSNALRKNTTIWGLGLNKKSSKALWSAWSCRSWHAYCKGSRFQNGSKVLRAWGKEGGSTAFGREFICSGWGEGVNL